LKRRYHRRRTRPASEKKRRDRPEAEQRAARLDPALKPVFRRIGKPAQGPFEPDPFQLEALRLIGDFDVLVSAPTGAGKTWIAEECIRDYLSRGLKTWYASPLKALSNSMYAHFAGLFGSDCCGIITGDRKENPDAPVVVGTTEILRNQLYDAMHAGGDIGADLVVLDEAHYLNDRFRGVVWEEVLIYLPSRVRLLLLSATVPNAHEVCAWLENIRGAPTRVVRSEERPVNLEMLFLFPDGFVAPLGGKKRLNPRIRKFAGPGAKKGRGGRAVPRFGEIVGMLRQLDLLPAIFFLKSRADCNRAIRSCLPVDMPVEKRKEIRLAVRDFLAEYPHLEGHRQMRPLTDSLVGSHHGGQLPYWKVLVEKMMNSGFLEAIFSTSTVAAGVNFPARTVVLVQSDRFDGRDFIDLNATDLHQMIGRAGRRGKDRIGFALLLPGPHQDPRLIHELSDSPAEPVESQIHINFSMTLNLLLSQTPGEVRGLLELSLAAYQRGRSGENILWRSFTKHLDFLKATGFVDDTDRLTPDGLWASKLRLDQPLLIAEAIRKGALDGVRPNTAAAGLAPFVWDRDQEISLRVEDMPEMDGIEETFFHMLADIKKIRAMKAKWGFDSPPIMFWPAAALFLWARGISWKELLRLVAADEGDMASLIMRTADHLRQVANLKETHPDLASTAAEAVKLILREPVYI